MYGSSMNFSVWISEFSYSELKQLTSQIKVLYWCQKLKKTKQLTRLEWVYSG